MLKIHTKQEERELGIDRGRGIEIYLWKAWRDGRSNVIGYAMTKKGAINDLKYSVQPDHDGTLDGAGVPKGTLIGDNMFSRRQMEDHNKSQFKK